MSKTTCITILSFLFIISSSLAGQYRVVNSVPNTPGGKRFNSEIGVPTAINTMRTINYFVWKIFKQNTDAQRKNVPMLTCHITELHDGAMGETDAGNNVHINALSIRDFPPGRAQYEFASLMYHEMTHIFQWSGKGTAPGGLTEGMADYVVIKSNYYDSKTFTKPGEGNRWDEGYGVTARFLEYCDSLRNGFTADLNNMMEVVYKDEYFNELLGKSVGQLWSEYKAKYGSGKSSIMSKEDDMY